MQSTSTVPVTSRYLWADFIRSVGILLVVLGHVSAVAVIRVGDFRATDWVMGNVYNVIARSCVPILFMVSGALLLPKQESLTNFYTKRVQKVILPFLFWSLLYLAVKESIFSNGVVIGLKTSILYIVTRPAEYHLWFMYELFGIYLITPIFRVFVNNAERSTAWYFMAIWFVLGPAQQQVEAWLGVQFIFNLGYLTGYIGYFILGYLLTGVKLTPRLIWLSSAVYILCAVFTVRVTVYMTIRSGTLFDFYQDLLGWNIVLLSLSAYILLRAAAEKMFSRPRPALEKIVLNLSAASFGMYLIHVFVMGFLDQFSAFPLSGPSTFVIPFHVFTISAPAAIMIPLATLATFVLSWAIISLMQKIPYVRALVA